MPQPTLSLTETQAFTALRSFILQAVLSPIEVIKGQQNLVGEPRGLDFVVMWPLFQNRIGTNVDTYEDNRVIGSISGNVLTVSQVLLDPLAVGQTLFDKSGSIVQNTIITGFFPGTTGGVGQYTVSIPQNVGSEIIYAGVRHDEVPTQWAVQLDVHGPNSADNARCIEGLFRSLYGADAFSASGIAIAPLYCDEARQMSFINAQDQYEDRWSLDLQMQINPVIDTAQQFAEEVHETLIPVDIFYI